MNRKKIKKYIPTTTLTILLSTINLAGTSIYANEPEIPQNTIPQLNILNIAAINNIDQYIDPNNLYQNSIMLSNIKNIYQQNDNNVPTIAANIISTIDNTPIYQPYIIQQVDNTTIGIIGIVSREYTLDTPKDTIIEDEIQTINKYTEELIDQGIENIVVLTDMQILEYTPSTTEPETENQETINDLHQKIDTQVDIIISENELNEYNTTQNIETENQDLLIIQTNENTIADITLNINPENNNIENEDIKLINTEEIIPPENEEVTPEDDTQIEPYIVGGSTDTNNQNPPTNNNDQEDDEEEDEDEDNEEDEDDEEEDEDTDEEDEDNEDNEEKSNDTIKLSSTKNPKTGDTSVLAYIVVGIGAILGLQLNRNKK